jgi:HEAT repeat protein
MAFVFRGLLCSAIALSGAGCAITTGISEQIGLTDHIPMHLGRTAEQWATDLDADDARIRREAAVAIGALEANALPAVPALVKSLQQGTEADRVHAAEALARLGPTATDAIAPLQGALDAASWKVRRAAVRALGHLHVVAAIPALIQHLEHDPGRWVRRAAGEALGEIGKPACRPLVEVLSRADSSGKQRATRALGYMGAAAAPSVPALARCLQNRDVREQAAKALGAIGPAAWDATDPLKDVLTDRDLPLWTRRRAANALGSIGAAAVQALVECLQNEDPLCKRYACGALAMMGPEGADASAPLSALLADSREAVRDSAARALAHIGEAAVPALVESIKGEDPTARHWAIDTVARIGKDAEGAVSALRRLLMPSNDSTDVWTRQRAAKAVAAIGQGAVAAAPALGGLLAEWPSPGWLIRVDVAEALGAIGPRAALAGSPLRMLLDDDRPEVREAASDALRKIERTARRPQRSPGMPLKVRQ